VKTCPKCGAAANDDDLFCEADGVKLPGEAVLAAVDARSSACPSCGLAHADEGDGYCRSCGHRMAPSTPRACVAIGTVLRVGESRFTVTKTREDDDALAESADGRRYLVAFGDTLELAQEESALTSLAGDPAFPSVDPRARAEPGGGFLLLSTVPEDWTPMTAIGSKLAVQDGLALARLALGLAATIESKGIGWAPRASDLFLRVDGTLAVARLRGAAPLAKGARLDAKWVLETVGDALLPYPLVHASPSLLDLFLRLGTSSNEPLTVDEARTILEAPDPDPEEPLPGLAELCHPGLQRDHNEDATAIAAGGTEDDRWSILVVCDGVSSSTHAEQASTIASRTTRDALAHFARSGDIAFEGAASAMKSAISAAHVAVCATGIEHGDSAPPGTTIVAALVHKRRLTIGWVGDSRAYWISAGGCELLTHDHSWVNETVAKGEMTESEALAAPLAHALTKCLGPLEVGDGTIELIDPDVRVRPLPGPGHLILCTDGLWNYFPKASEIAALVHSAGALAHAGVLARVLVNHALVKGGFDNVSVAVCVYGDSVHYTRRQ
jgi:serine/threonine protein phosphatase PrpC